MYSGSLIIHRGMSMIVCVTVAHKEVCYDCRECAILAFINLSIILKESGPQNSSQQRLDWSLESITLSAQRLQS